MKNSECITIEEHVAKRDRWCDCRFCRAGHEWFAARERKATIDPSDGQVTAIGRAMSEVKRDPSITIARLAQATGYSSRSFYRIFRGVTGLTPNQYRTRIRLDRASDLIVRTDLPISRIIARVGYSSEAQFCRRFAQVFQAPPGAYRRHHQDSHVQNLDEMVR